MSASDQQRVAARTWISLFSEFRGYPRRLWLVCFAAYVTVQIEFALWSLALPSLRAEFDLSSSQVGVLTGLTFALGGILVVALSTLADRFGRRLLLIVGTLAAAIFSGLHVLATGIVVLAIVRICAIGFSGLVFPSTGALVAEEAPARIRGLMVGMLQVAVPMGWLIAALTGSVVLETLGWRALFLVAILGLPAAALVYRYVRESPLIELEAGGSSRITSLFCGGMWRRTVPLFLAQGCFALAFGGGFVLMPLYLHDAFGYGASEAGVLVAVANAMGLLGYLAAAWVGEFHWTRRTTIVVGTFCAALAFAVFASFAQTHPSVLVAFAILTFFLLGTSAVKLPYIAELYPTGLRATGIAFASSLAIHSGLAFGPAIVGTLVDRAGWSQALLLGGVLPLLVASLLFLLLPPLPSGLDMREIESHLQQGR